MEKDSVRIPLMLNLTKRAVVSDSPPEPTVFTTDPPDMCPKCKKKTEFDGRRQGEDVYWCKKCDLKYMVGPPETIKYFDFYYNEVKK